MATEGVGATLRPEPGTVNVEIHASHIATITLRGECDISTAPQISNALARATHATNTMVDLSECEFIDSTIIGTLVAALHDANTRGNQFSIILPPTATPVVQRIFGVMHLRELFPVHASAPGHADSPA